MAEKHLFLAPHSTSSLWSMPFCEIAALLKCISARWPHHVPSSLSPAPNKLLPNINFDEIKLDLFFSLRGTAHEVPASTCVRVDFLHRSMFWYLARNCLVHGSFRTVLKWVQLFWFIYFFISPSVGRWRDFSWVPVCVDYINVAQDLCKYRHMYIITQFSQRLSSVWIISPPDSSILNEF